MISDLMKVATKMLQLRSFTAKLVKISTNTIERLAVVVKDQRIRVVFCRMLNDFDNFFF